MQLTSPYIRCLFFIIAIFFTGLSNSVAQQVEQRKEVLEIDKVRQWTVLYNLLEPKATDSSMNCHSGQPIPLPIAEGCINDFPRSMRRHGIMNQNGTFTIRLRRSLKITRTVSFIGRDLLHWIDSVVQANDKPGQGLNLSVDIRMGTYNQRYLDHIQADDDEKSRRSGRFGIFIVVRKKRPCLNDEAQKVKTRNDDDIAAYDFGGLQP